jgi:hypothetical protein
LRSYSLKLWVEIALRRASIAGRQPVASVLFKIATSAAASGEVATSTRANAAPSPEVLM